MASAEDLDIGPLLAAWARATPYWNSPAKGIVGNPVNALLHSGSLSEAVAKLEQQFVCIIKISLNNNHESFVLANIHLQ